MRASGGLLDARRRGGSRLRRWLLDPEYPATAVEVRAGALGVVRLVREGGRWRLGAAASLDLPEGTLRLSMVQPNIAEPAVFARTLRAVLERAGVLGGGRVALVLPDPVARVALLPAVDVRGRGRAEVEEMIRFRLRKAVPFDVREARVAYVPPPTAEGMVLASAVYRPVLEAYEEACLEAGLEPGLVELAGLALLGTVEGGRPPADRLLVNWDMGYVSFLLTQAGRPVLIRTLTGEAASEPQHVAQEATQTVLYYRDRLGGAGLSGAVVRSAALPEAEAVALLKGPLGLEPEVLDLWGPLGVGERLSAAQAVAGAAACVLGRAA